MDHALKCGKMLLCFRSHVYARESFFLLSFSLSAKQFLADQISIINSDNSTTRRQSDSIFAHRYARVSFQFHARGS